MDVCHRVWLLLAGLLISTCAFSSNLSEDFDRAQRHDPAFAALLAESEIGKLQARMAASAFFPEARLSASQLDNESTSRVTLTVSQPLLNYDRWLTLKEAEPRMAQTAIRLEQGQQELALRLLAAVTALVQAQDKLSLNASAMAALEQQRNSAKQSFDFGVGTITDLRDTEVRLAIAKAQSFSLRADLENAQSAYRQIVGQASPALGYRLSFLASAPRLESLGELTQRALQRNTRVRAGELTTRLAVIASNRARAALYPSVSAAAQRSQGGGTSALTSSQVAIRMDIPLQMGTWLRFETADLELKRLQEVERDTRQKVMLEVERLYAQVQALGSEIAVRNEAMAAAELSFKANERSFAGGFRTKIDVLNALQATYQAKADYAVTVLRLAEALISLRLAIGEPIVQVLRDAQQAFFASARSD